MNMFPRSSFFKFLFLGLFLISWVERTTSFSTTFSNVRHTITNDLKSVAIPHDEDQRERIVNNNDNNDDEWTKVEGGFLPRVRFKKRPPKKFLTKVSNLIDYKHEVVDCEEDIVVVKFYAPWCRSCKAMEPLYKRLAYTKSSASVKFVQVPITQDNTVLHQGLGVPSVPFGHIYHKDAGLVEELKIKKKEFSNFEKILQTYMDGECELVPEPSP
mmetsp:Transcript_11207/g.12834  ORF Transcript_11207/g.12834 Transcript_11207/m.12834 type:complete len:214 (-) Transcript_11207:47-688(-)